MRWWGSFSLARRISWGDPVIETCITVLHICPLCTDANDLFFASQVTAVLTGVRSVAYRDVASTIPIVLRES
jgi:hypothetical protein